jgi:ligand-binding sensor domain-containing protein/serine phosphatase RsbU (regulator of sigma subunit)
MRIQHLKYLIILSAFSCAQQKKNITEDNAPVQLEFEGYHVPVDSLQDPLIFVIENPDANQVLAGDPAKIATNTNRHSAGEPIVVKGKNNPVFTLGQDSILLPTQLQVYDSSFLAGMPEIIVAKDGYTKDQNPQNFKSLSKLQGLKHGNIRCLIEDHLGNIWLGTEGGGVSKYDGKSFTHFTEKEGLPYNDVRCIMQDSKNNIWFGTNGAGIAKYDGKSFIHYKGNSEFSEYDVLCLEEDSEGNIWMGTDGFGAVKYTPSGNENDSLKFTAYSIQQGLPGNIVWTIEKDLTGNLWFGTEEAGIAFFDGVSFVHFSSNHGLAGNHVLTIYADKKGSLWIGTEGNGFSKLSFEEPSNPNQGYTFFNYNQSMGLSGNVVSNIFEDQQGTIWLSSPGNGVCRFVNEGQKGYSYFDHFGSEEGLTNEAISSSLEDRSGNIWFATYGGGIAKYDGKLFTHFTQREGLSSQHIWSMTEDADGNMWFGSAGGGVSKYDGSFFYNYNVSQGLCHNDIRSMFTDQNGNLWFGSQGKGVSKYTPGDAKRNVKETFTTYDENSGLFGSDVRNIIQDKNGNIWFALSGSGLTKYDGKTFTHFKKEHGLSGNDVRCVLADRDGNIWVGTNGEGVTKIESVLSDGKITYSFKHFRESEGFPSDFIICAYQDKSENIWFGSYGNGIIKVSQKEESDTYSIVALTEEKGLANNFVFSIVEDFDGNMWFGTRFGLSKLSPEKLNLFNKKLETNTFTPSDVFFKNYTYEDGFLGIGCNGKSIFQSKDKTIWIGSNDRLTACHLGGENTFADTIAPKIQITGISLFNEKIPWTSLIDKKDTAFVLGNGVEVGDFEFDDLSRWYGVPQNLSLSHENNYLTFQFIGITMYQPASVKYQYKLEGFDQNWSAIDKRTEAPYGNLPHGDYTFRVKAMSGDGIWSDEVTFNFTIRPPWWHTWMFRISAAVFVIVVLYLIFLWRTASLRTRQKQLEKTVKERTLQVTEQKQLIEQKHKEITDSINYAERIQRSFLATHELLRHNFNDYFVFFKPKDVVSGDFYWATNLSNGTFALVTADSTGHGVPGAIMSILNIACLEKAVDEEKLTEPDEILNYTRLKIIERLKKDGSADGGKDGMDGSLVCFDFENRIVKYAAANNPIWIVRRSEILVFEPDKMPVAKHDKEHIPFTAKNISVEKGDLVYTFTDGFADQFGGNRGKKFMYKRLKQLFISVAHLPMSEQENQIEKAFNDWRGNLEQVDDVCIFGVRI